MPDWNKEISFRRGKRPAPAEAAAPKPQKESFLKKEISFSRKPKAPKEPRPADAVPFWKKEIGRKKKEKPARPADAVPFWKKEIGRKKKEKPAPVAAAAEAASPAAAEPAPAPADYSWLTETLEAYAPAPAPEPAPTGAWPPRSDEPVVAAAWPPRSEELPPPPPPAPVAVQPGPVVAPAAEPEAGPAPGPAQPFWKKELSLGRSKAPKPEQAKGEPFWKKELSLGRSKAPRAERPPKPEKAKGEPFWKRELSLGRSKAPRAERPPTPEKAKGEPFWKKELSFGARGGKAATAEKPPKAKGEPFWKRDLSFGGPAKGPKPAKPGAAGTRRKENATLVGLKIGASQVAAARVHNNGRPQLLQVAREPIDDGVVVGGELRDVEALAEALKRFFAKNKLPKKGIRLGIANNRIGVRTFEIAGIDDPRQLANAIRFRAQETLPIPLEEAVLDWQVLREEVNEEGVATRRVLLVVAYRELVDRYVLACKKAGLRLEGIDLEAFAVLRALSEPSAEGDQPLGAQVVVNVGHDRSTFAVTDGRVCEFTRVLAWGGQNLNVAIARALDLTPSEAAPLKHAVSLTDSSVALEDVTAETAAVVCDAVRAELQAFARELVSSLRFYQNQPGSLGIAELLLTGGTAELDGLAAELETLTGVSVRVGDPFHRVRLAKKLHEPDQVGSLAVAIGLGIED